MNGGLIFAIERGKEALPLAERAAGCQSYLEAGTPVPAANQRVANPPKAPDNKERVTLTPRLSAAALTASLLLSVLVGTGTAATTGAAITGARAIESCFASIDGTCSATATADMDGTFAASAQLISPDSPLTRAGRYSMGLGLFTIGFDLPAPSREATINVTLHLDDASASWAKIVPDIFGGTQNPNSGAKVLFQLLGDEAPDGCGCSWPSQEAADVIVARAATAGDSSSVSDSLVQMTMTARNPGRDGILPAGHYEVMLRAYALAELFGPGDWGTLNAAMSGRIEDITVTTPSETSTLSLSVAGNGSNRVLTATLTDGDATPIDGQTISFYGDGEFLGTSVTEGGIATFNVLGRFRGGTHLFRAEFGGNDRYSAASSEASS